MKPFARIFACSALALCISKPASADFLYTVHTVNVDGTESYVAVAVSDGIPAEC